MEQCGKLSLEDQVYQNFKKVDTNVLKSTPFFVLSLNPWVHDPDYDIYIPGEIAVVAFSITQGRMDKFCRIIYQPQRILGEDVVNKEGNESKYRFPPPPADEDSVTTPEYYLDIVDQLEEMMKKQKNQTQSSHRQLFAREQDVEAFTCGMKWLYEKAGKEFHLQIWPLETLLEVMIEVDWDNKWTPQLLHWVPKNLRPGIVKGPELREKLKSGRMKEEDCKSLACGYHLGRLDMMPKRLRIWWNRLKKGQRPEEAFRECALLKAQEVMYLALETVMEYYPEVESFENHFPILGDRPVDPNLEIEDRVESDSGSGNE